MNLMVVGLMLFQYPYPDPGSVPDQLTPHLPGTNTRAVATFNGSFKSADRKFLFIDVEDGNTLQIHITGSTKFIRGDKPAKASDFHPGENVTVDAARDARLNLLAVRVTAVSAKAPRVLPDTDKH